MYMFDMYLQVVPDFIYDIIVQVLVGGSSQLVSGSMVTKSPFSRVVGPLPIGQFMAFKLGVIPATYKWMFPSLYPQIMNF